MTKSGRKTRKMVLASFFLVLGLVLPFFTGQIPEIGNMLLPMHLPVLLCGFVCGWQYGMLVGIMTPLVRSLLFTMPVLFPNAVGMAVELGVYGFCAGWLGRRFGRRLSGIYPALLLTMCAGRVAWGVTSFALFGMLGKVFTWELFLAQSVLNAVPGIVLQLILVPLLVRFIPQEYAGNLKSSCVRRFAPVVTEIERLLKEPDRERIVVALDGKCASGKTTLGCYLKEKFDANLFHMDDFFLQEHQRTPERLAETGGNVDYERFREEVLLPLFAGEPVAYRRFDCKTLQMQPAKTIMPKRVNVIEGSYSHHPYFDAGYDIKVFMEIAPDKQLENIQRRNGRQKLQVFREQWIPKEEAYFATFAVKEKSDIVIFY